MDIAASALPAQATPQGGIAAVPPAPDGDFAATLAQACGAALVPPPGQGATRIAPGLLAPGAVAPAPGSAMALASPPDGAAAPDPAPPMPAPNAAVLAPMPQPTGEPAAAPRIVPPTLPDTLPGTTGPGPPTDDTSQCPFDACAADGARAETQPPEGDDTPACVGEGVVPAPAFATIAPDGAGLAPREPTQRRVAGPDQASIEQPTGTAAAVGSSGGTGAPQGMAPAEPTGRLPNLAPRPRAGETLGTNTAPRIAVDSEPPALQGPLDALPRVDATTSSPLPAGDAPLAGIDPRRGLDPAAPAPAQAMPDPRMASPIDAAAKPAEAAVPDPPRAPPPSAPARQVVPAVVAVAIGGAGRITVTLEPGELGRVEISVERNGDAPQVVILAERPETLALLQRDQRDIDRALTQAGLQSEGRALSFGLSGGDAGSGQSQRRRDGPGGDHAARGVQSLDVTGSIAAAPARRVAVSLLDLAI